MGQALYRKYRTTSLAETPGQEHITKALDQALKTSRLSHAYLFTGPRGVGKTSIARILAHAVNDLPYGAEPHLDIIEIDAASNRRIDEIRDLRDKVYIAPASARYKVYIIDEVHMLTREAFNALLKTLEEPPAHVIFILATTDAHKLPATIVSRTQRYSFRPIAPEVITKRLRYIADQEGIAINDEALQLLAVHGGGSFRDSISLLDQVGNHAEAVDAEAVRLYLGIPSETAIVNLLTLLPKGDIPTVIKALQTLFDGGFTAAAVASQLASQLRVSLVSNASILPDGQTLTVLQELLSVAGSTQPERSLELVLMRATTPVDTPAPVAAAIVSQPTPTTAPAAIPATKPVTSKPKPAAPTTPKPAPKSEPAVTVKPAEAAVTPTVPTGTAQLDAEGWAQVLNLLKKQYNTVYGIARMAQTDFSQPGRAHLTFTFAFHQKRINDPKNKKIISDYIEQVTGEKIELTCSVSSDAKPAKVIVAQDALQDISSVFGGGELL